MKKQFVLSCLVILCLVACTKEFKDDILPDASSDRIGAQPMVVTSLKDVLSGLVNRDYHNVMLRLSDYYAPTSKVIGQRPLYTVNGIVVNAYWKDLQSAYNGAITANNVIDSLVKFAADSSQYGIKIKIRVFAGLYSPTWVKTNATYGGGTKAIPFKTDDDDGNPITDTLPKYWDNGYIDAYKKFMTKLGQKYDTCVNVLEVTGAIGDISTVEPFFLKCGLPGTNLNYNTANGTDFYQNALNLYNANITSDAHSYAICRGIAIMDSAWNYTHISLCFSPFQILTKTGGTASQPNFSLTQNIDSTKRIIDYFVTLNGVKGIMGNNGIRDAATMPSQGSYQDWLPPNGSTNGDMVLLCSYMRSKLFSGTTRKSYLYFQTVQANAIGDFTNTLDTALSYKADMVETPYLSSTAIPNAEKTIPVLKYYDSAFVSKATP